MSQALINKHESSKEGWAACDPRLEKLLKMRGFQYNDTDWEVKFAYLTESHQIMETKNKRKASKGKRIIAEEIKLRQKLILDCWDQQGACHYWNVLWIKGTRGTRDFDPRMQRDIWESVKRFISDLSPSDSNMRNTMEEWKDELTLRLRDAIGIEGNRSVWMFLGDPDWLKQVPQAWAEELHNLYTRWPLDVAPDDAVAELRWRTEYLQTKAMGYVDIWNEDSLIDGFRTTRTLLRRAYLDMADLSFRHKIIEKTVPPPFSDLSVEGFRVFSEETKKCYQWLKIGAEEWLSSCLQTIEFDRICEGYAWHFLWYSIEAPGDTFILAWSCAEALELSLLLEEEESVKSFKVLAQEFMLKSFTRDSKLVEERNKENTESADIKRGGSKKKRLAEEEDSSLKEAKKKEVENYGAAESQQAAGKKAAKVEGVRAEVAEIEGMMIGNHKTALRIDSRLLGDKSTEHQILPLEELQYEQGQVVGAIVGEEVGEESVVLKPGNQHNIVLVVAEEQGKGKNIEPLWAKGLDKREIEEETVANMDGLSADILGDIEEIDTESFICASSPDQSVMITYLVTLWIKNLFIITISNGRKWSLPFSPGSEVTRTIGPYSVMDNAEHSMRFLRYFIEFLFLEELNSGIPHNLVQKIHSETVIFYRQINDESSGSKDEIKEVRWKTIGPYSVTTTPGRFEFLDILARLLEKAEKAACTQGASAETRSTIGSIGCNESVSPITDTNHISKNSCIPSVETCQHFTPPESHKNITSSTSIGTFLPDGVGQAIGYLQSHHKSAASDISELCEEVYSLRALITILIDGDSKTRRSAMERGHLAVPFATIQTNPTIDRPSTLLRRRYEYTDELPALRFLGEINEVLSPRSPQPAPRLYGMNGPETQAAKTL